ncbi:MAG: Rossmann-like and DUF2520 domain-containing protein [Pyrinomonadaceae bacterium]
MPKAKSPDAKPTVSIIGAGRLGQALAIALRSSGYPILALVARRRQKAEKAVALLGEAPGSTPARATPRPLAFGANQLAKLPKSDLILLATPDDAIEKTAKILAASLGPGVWRRTILHTSGALSSAALAPLAKREFQTGSIHPLVSVSDPTSGAAALHGAFFCLEGTRKAKLLAAAIVCDLGGKSFTIKPESKALYHTAAVMVSPNLTALVDIATEMLAACGLSKHKAQQVFVPLLESTVNNLKTSNPRQALTGTFARGDVATVRRHLQALSDKELAEARAVYKLLGLHSLRLAEKNGLDPQLVAKIEKLLRAHSSFES